MPRHLLSEPASGMPYCRALLAGTLSLFGATERLQPLLDLEARRSDFRGPRENLAQPNNLSTHPTDGLQIFDPHLFAAHSLKAG